MIRYLLLDGSPHLPKSLTKQGHMSHPSARFLSVAIPSDTPSPEFLPFIAAPSIAPAVPILNITIAPKALPCRDWPAWSAAHQCRTAFHFLKLRRLVRVVSHWVHQIRWRRVGWLIGLLLSCRSHPNPHSLFRRDCWAILWPLPPAHKATHG